MRTAIAVRTALVCSSILAFGFAGVACSGAQLSPEVAQARLRACQVAAFVPVLGSAERASYVVEALRAGTASVQEVIDQAGATADQLYALEADLRACVIAHAPAE